MFDPFCGVFYPCLKAVPFWDVILITIPELASGLAMTWAGLLIGHVFVHHVIERYN